MKKKIYLRVGKTKAGKYKVDARFNPTPEPIWSESNARTRKALPTVRFAVEVEIPEEKFDLEWELVGKVNCELDKKRIILSAAEAL